MGLDEVLARYPGAETFRFGDTPELTGLLTELVRVGKKRATCISEAELAGGEAMPVVGRCDVALNADGTPALVIRTVELRKTTFAEMTEEMALMEGENDSLDGWRDDHARYFRERGWFAPDMVLIWERFELVEDFAA